LHPSPSAKGDGNQRDDGNSRECTGLHDPDERRGQRAGEVVDGPEEPPFRSAWFGTGDDERRKKHHDEPNNGAHDVASMAAEIAQLDCLGAHSRRHVSHCGQTTPSASARLARRACGARR
jgi:hypothetical protein